mmetsp:Transcript_4576/g.13212  ORF Transcript_4576/g.13212 Transcript_4576/m.13212 type:complete len:345 (+) Transcript_4576:690-1724(+)
MEGTPDDFCHARAPGPVHFVQISSERSRALQHGCRYPDKHGDAVVGRKDPNGSRSASDAPGRPIVHRRTRRTERRAVYEKIRNARTNQRGNFHRHGQSPGFHRSRQTQHVGYFDGHESLHQRGRWLPDRLSGRKPARSSLQTHGRSHHGPRGPGSHGKTHCIDRGRSRRRQREVPDARGRKHRGSRCVRIGHAGRHYQATGARVLVVDSLLPTALRARGNSRHQPPDLVRQETHQRRRPLFLPESPPERVRRHVHVLRGVRVRHRVHAGARLCPRHRGGRCGPELDRRVRRGDHRRDAAGAGAALSHRDWSGRPRRRGKGHQVDRGARSPIRVRDDAGPKQVPA